MAAASDFTASVLASPGTPSTSRCPPDSMATAIRSSRTSWPTMVRLTSNSTGSSGFDDMIILRRRSGGSIGSCRSGSQLGTAARTLAGRPAQRRTDRNGEADTGERVLLAGVGDGQHDADHRALVVQQ